MGSTISHDKYVNEAQAVAFMRPRLKVDELYNSVKRNRQTKNADILWVQESSFQTVLFNSQKNGWTACPLAYFVSIIFYSQSLVIECKAFKVIFLLTQHCKLRLWTLESNSGLDPGSVIYWL